MRAGYKLIREVMKGARWDSRPRLPENCLSSALAKCCWEDLSMAKFFLDGWHDEDYAMLEAMRDFASWVSGNFEGGHEWMESAYASVDPDHPGHYIYLELDKTGKFVECARYLCAFVRRGGPVLSYRRREAETFEQLEMELT